MNKRMIILIALALLATVGAGSAGTAVDEVEIRGTVVEANSSGDLKVAGSVGPYCSGYIWTPYTFGAFWYELDDDLSSEMLSIDAPLNGRTITADNLTYATTPQAQTYAAVKDGEVTEIGEVGSTDVTQYYMEGWMAEKYVAISTGGSTAANANKLAKLLVEFETSSDKKTLKTGEAWDLGGGFTLNVTQIDLENDTVDLSLAKGGEVLNETTINTSTDGDRRYMYTEDLSVVNDVVVFFCYVDAVFSESNLTQLTYVYLIDNDILNVSAGANYGNMEVKTASATQVILKNDGAIDLSQNADVEIMGDMYFRVADNYMVRFYPLVKRTINGTVPTPPETIPAADVDGDGVPDVWDADNSTPLDYWTDSDGIGRKWGDMNGDDRLTSVDALMILQAAAGKIGL